VRLRCCSWYYHSIKGCDRFRGLRCGPVVGDEAHSSRIGRMRYTRSITLFQIIDPKGRTESCATVPPALHIMWGRFSALSQDHRDGSLVDAWSSEAPLAPTSAAGTAYVNPGGPTSVQLFVYRKFQHPLRSRAIPSTEGALSCGICLTLQAPSRSFRAAKRHQFSCPASVACQIRWPSLHCDSGIDSAIFISGIEGRSPIGGNPSPLSTVKRWS
jgi:hypothetical protein